jgi:TonB family protein
VPDEVPKKRAKEKKLVFTLTVGHDFLKYVPQIHPAHFSDYDFLESCEFSATGIEQGDTDQHRLSEEQARALATYPVPQYPFQARAKHLHGGAGLVRLDVTRRTGYVTSARMLQGTGHQILDDESLKTFRAWRLKPGTVSSVMIPVRFVMGPPHWPQTVDPKYPREASDKGVTGSGRR